MACEEVLKCSAEAPGVNSGTTTKSPDLIDCFLRQDAQNVQSVPTGKALRHQFLRIMDRLEVLEAIEQSRDEVLCMGLAPTDPLTVDQEEVFNAMQISWGEHEKASLTSRRAKNEKITDDPEVLFRVASFCLATLTGIDQLVEWLFDVGQPWGVAGIRYHYLSNSDQRLVSVECAGQSKEVTARIRGGQIRKKLRGEGREQFDSYLCFKQRKPTVFLVDQQSPGIRFRGHLGGVLPCFVVDVDCCESDLPDKGRLWVDVPLISSGRFIGKLSCDLVATNIAEINVEKLLSFWRLAQYAAPYFSALYFYSVTAAFERTKDEINNCKSLDELLEYLTRKLPEVFGCEHASVFAASEDSDDRKLLILHRTSFDCIREWGKP